VQPSLGGPAHLLRFPELAIAARPVLLIALGYSHRRWTCLVCQSRKHRCNHKKRSVGPSESESLDTTVCLYHSVAASSVNDTF
jgi:hypothetical protein